jgi:galactokinase
MNAEEAWIDAARSDFTRDFGRPAEWAAFAPGRVNLIGEHTDYNQGLALPCAIDRQALVLAAPRSDRQVRVRAWDLGEEGEFLSAAPRRRGTWLDYVQGAFSVLAERGIDAPGFDLGITSRVPLNAGLSSSAALGVAMAAGLGAALGLEMSAYDWARAAHRAENEFVGVRCGLLDPFASALGRKGHALRIDCRSERVEAVAISGGDLGILLVHSGVERRVADGAYGQRVAECARAVAAAVEAGIAPASARVLRDLEGVDPAALERVLDPVAFQRARHVLGENRRVIAFCRALKAGDRPALGSLLAQGQASLRDDYAVSTPEIDLLCQLGADCDGVVGSRLTGAGLGGFTLHLVVPDRMERARRQISEGFEARFGRRPQTLAALPSQGARVERVRA